MTKEVSWKLHPSLGMTLVSTVPHSVRMQAVTKVTYNLIGKIKGGGMLYKVPYKDYASGYAKKIYRCYTLLSVLPIQKDYYQESNAHCSLHSPYTSAFLICQYFSPYPLCVMTEKESYFCVGMSTNAHQWSSNKMFGASVFTRL